MNAPPRSGHGDRRPRRSLSDSSRGPRPGRKVRLSIAVSLVGALVGACGSDSKTPEPTAPPVGASIWIDREWTASGGSYRFTGSADPDFRPSTVALETATGPSPSFGNQVVIVGKVSAPTQIAAQVPLPDGVESCVRFVLLSEAGTIASQSLCISVPVVPGSASPTQ
jgi:hypothetical protein